ncbi:hypothetical protein BDZ91DRAFT_791871 [Kalaharituber pfeilii]|nr:hypothetical protein BDZ91DRAFT_791871 [Kalaharituber pfeilii]
MSKKPSPAPSPKPIPKERTLPQSGRAIVVHGIAVTKKLGKVRDWMENASPWMGKIVAARWLVKKERREGKKASSVVIYLEGEVELDSQTPAKKIRTGRQFIENGTGCDDEDVRPRALNMIHSMQPVLQGQGQYDKALECSVGAMAGLPRLQGKYDKALDTRTHYWKYWTGLGLREGWRVRPAKPEPATHEGALVGAIQPREEGVTFVDIPPKTHRLSATRLTNWPKCASASVRDKSPLVGSYSHRSG